MASPTILEHHSEHQWEEVKLPSGPFQATTQRNLLLKCADCGTALTGLKSNNTSPVCDACGGNLFHVYSLKNTKSISSTTHPPKASCNTTYKPTPQHKSAAKTQSNTTLNHITPSQLADESILLSADKYDWKKIRFTSQPFNASGHHDLMLKCKSCGSILINLTGNNEIICDTCNETQFDIYTLKGAKKITPKSSAKHKKSPTTLQDTPHSPIKPSAYSPSTSSDSKETNEASSVTKIWITSIFIFALGIILLSYQQDIFNPFEKITNSNSKLAVKLVGAYITRYLYPSLIVALLSSAVLQSLTKGKIRKDVISEHKDYINVIIFCGAFCNFLIPILLKNVLNIADPMGVWVFIWILLCGVSGYAHAKLLESFDTDSNIEFPIKFIIFSLSALPSVILFLA